MDDELLTKKELIKRWKITQPTMDRWIREGVISPAKGIPSPRFPLRKVMELEGVKLEPFSPLLKKKMEREIEELKEENSRLKQTLNSMISEGLKVINY